MKALAWVGRGDVRVVDRAPAALAADAVRVQVAWCGVCGSDVEEWREGPVAVPGPEVLGADGIVLGHELAGTVAAVGAEVTGWLPGDRVGVHTVLPCGRCAWCLAGQTPVCPQQDIVGLTVDGGFAEHVDVPARQLIRVPGTVGLDTACLAEPLAVAVRAVARASALGPPGPATVVGAGTVGLLTAWVAARRGYDVVVTDRDPRRADIVARLGLRFSADPVVLPVPSTGFDCTGSPAVLGAWAAATAPQSVLVVLGVAVEPAPVSLYAMLAKELTVLGSVSHTRAEYEQAVALLDEAAGSLDVLITDRLALEDGPALLARLAEGGAGTVKALLTPLPRRAHA